MKRIGLILGIILVCGIVGISGCTSSGANQTTAQKVSDGDQMFQNKFITFKIPNGMSVQDNSTDTKLDVLLNMDNAEIGEINSAVANQNDVKSLGGTETKIAGKTAYETFDNTGINSYISLNTKEGIWISLDPGYNAEYNVIIDSLQIKQIPTQ